MQLPQLSQVDMPDPKAQAPKSAYENTETPEDVATLYSWANLHGAKYRDFSAARAQAREAARVRMEEAAAAERRRQQEEAERILQEEAQRAAREAAEAAEEARQAEAERLAELARQAEVERQAVLTAQEAQRVAAQQRAWQSPGTAHAAAAPAVLYAAPVRTAPSAVAVPTPPPSAAAAFASPVAIPPAPPVLGVAEPTDRISAPAARASELLVREAPIRDAKPILSSPSPAYPEMPSFFSVPTAEEASPSWPGSVSEVEDDTLSGPSWLASKVPAVVSKTPQATPAPTYTPAPPNTPPAAALASAAQSSASPFSSMSSFGGLPFPIPYAPLSTLPLPATGIQAVPAPPPALPAAGVPGPLPPSTSQASAGPSLTPYGGQESAAQRGAGNRWFALKSVFDPHVISTDQAPVQQSAQAPVLAVFSLAGGVGKTSLIASLGRALSARGEQVLLVDTTAYGLLPFFFGARDQRPGHLRTFNPPGVSLEAPVQLITLDPESQASDSPTDTSLSGGPQSDRPQEWLSAEITRLGRGHHRVLVDLPSASGATTRRILRLNPIVLVPVVPDMSSVVSVGAIESFFRHNGALGGGKLVQPYYLLNQFDYSLPLHLDVRELLREQIGERLLPFTLRRSTAVSEALAEGMTVMDYAPSVPLAEDFSSLAGWVRSLAGPATQVSRGVRWSER